MYIIYNIYININIYIYAYVCTHASSVCKISKCSKMTYRINVFNFQQHCCLHIEVTTGVK